MRVNTHPMKICASTMQPGQIVAWQQGHIVRMTSKKRSLPKASMGTLFQAYFFLFRRTWLTDRRQCA